MAQSDQAPADGAAPAGGGAKVLVIDDFMKAGGTARGLIDLASEVGANVVGTGVLIATDQPEKKLVDLFYKIDQIQQPLKSFRYSELKLVHLLLSLAHHLFQESHISIQKLW